MRRTPSGLHVEGNGALAGEGGVSCATMIATADFMETVPCIKVVVRERDGARRAAEVVITFEQGEQLAALIEEAIESGRQWHRGRS